jgi:hypothetical protein
MIIRGEEEERENFAEGLFGFAAFPWPYGRTTNRDRTDASVKSPSKIILSQIILPVLAGVPA